MYASPARIAITAPDQLSRIIWIGHQYAVAPNAARNGTIRYWDADTILVKHLAFGTTKYNNKEINKMEMFLNKTI